jgi:hypothetical protein
MTWSRPTASRGLVVAIVALGFRVGAAHAQSAPQLVLPLVTAIAVASAAANAPAYIKGAKASDGRPMLSIIPRQIDIPDAYEYDVDDFTFRRNIAPIDPDRLVAFDLINRPRHGWTASLAYDNESRGPMGYNSDVVTFEVEYPW